MKRRVRAALERLDRRFGTETWQGGFTGYRLARDVGSGFSACRFLIAGLWFATGRAERGVVVKLPFDGHLLDVYVPDLAALRVLDEIFALDQYRREGPTDPTVILDLGANIGASAIFYAMTYPSAKIVCVEADPVIAAILARNTRKIDASVVNAAVTEAAGTVSFNQSAETWAGSVGEPTPSAVEVEGRTLQSFIDEYRPDLIKIDVEGAEYGVFRSSPDLRSVRTIVGEIHSPPAAQETRAILEALSTFDVTIEDYGDLTLFRANRSL